MPDRPNLVFINVDQMRADCLGAAGHPVVETPNLDAMVRSGVLFSQAYTAVPSCIAARAAMLTGLSQRSHGRVGYRDGVPWDYEITLPGELAKAGYHTQGIGKMHFHPSRNLCGFHNVVLHDGYLHFNRKHTKVYEQHDDYTPWLKQHIGHDIDYIDHGINCNSWVARPWHLPEYLHPTNWVVTQAIDFLRRRDPRKPFFLWMSFVRPHAPLDPPQVYFDQYIQQDIPSPPIGDWAETEDPQHFGWIPDTTRGILDPRAQHRAMAAYYALITHIDHQIGRFMEVLGEYEQLHNTLFLFASDHGELLGDHNLFRKALPYDGSARVPFLIRFPRSMGISSSMTIDKPVELRDILPTFLDAAGVAIPESIEGQSLIPICRGDNNHWREYVHGEHAYGANSNHYVTNGREKYIWFSQTGQEQFFDIASDPQELHDLASDPRYQGRIAYWRQVLIRELEGREEGYTDGERLIPGRPARACLSHILPEAEGS